MLFRCFWNVVNMHTKKFLLLYVIILYPLVNLAQTSLLNRKINIAFYGVSIANNIELKENFIDFNRMTCEVLKKLEKKYTYIFINNTGFHKGSFSHSQNFKTDYVIHFSINNRSKSGGDPFSSLNTARPGQFNYVSKIQLIDNKSGNILVTERILWKDLLSLSSDTARLFTNLHEEFGKVLKLIAVPMDTVLTPQNKAQKLPVIAIIHFISYDDPKLKNHAQIITDLINNIVIFHQSNFSYNYCPEYRIPNMDCKIHNVTISGRLTESADSKDYIFQLDYNKTGLNMAYKPNNAIQSIFRFDKNRIDQNDYMQVINKLNRSIYHFLKNNFQAINIEPYTIRK